MAIERGFHDIVELRHNLWLESLVPNPRLQGKVEFGPIRRIPVGEVLQKCLLHLPLTLVSRAPAGRHRAGVAANSSEGNNLLNRFVYCKQIIYNLTI